MKLKRFSILNILSILLGFLAVVLNAIEGNYGLSVMISVVVLADCIEFGRRFGGQKNEV